MLGVMTSENTMTLAFINDLLHPSHMIIILVIALLIFGHRLPEVGRSLGKSIVEFKKGIKGIEDEVNDAGKRPDVDRQIEQEKPYRAPLTSEGKDARVSRGSAQEPVATSHEGEKSA